jgi:geranylgeranyl diphosphate synthase type II
MTTAQELLDRVLAEDQRLVRDALNRAIPDAEPRRHLYDLIRGYQARAGKGFRASLCLSACRAFGGKTEDAIDVAVALELLHSAFLIHDDIADGATLRRGHPALHLSHGVGLALNASDGLCALAMSSLARCAARQPSEVAGALMAEIAHLFRRTVEGQALEMGWIADQRFDITEADYLRMVLGKTCWYSTIHPCRLGALVGSKGQAQLKALVPFGCYLGAAFQLRDDIDNLAPGDQDYGKDVAGDLIEGKRTIPLLHLLARCSEAQRQEVEQLMSAACPLGRETRIQRVLQLMAEFGSLEYARDIADSFARLALKEIPVAFEGAERSKDVDYFTAMVLYMSGALRPSSDVRQGVEPSECAPDVRLTG